jgi:transcriptional regulator with XRE-family HTH domain
VGCVPAGNEIGEFLRTRRARLRPEGTGLPAYGDRRRVPGLRREEVALLAGVSVEYYTRIERGRAGAVSDDVIEGIANALQLDDAEHAHLIDLLHTDSSAPTRRRPPQQRVRPEVQRVLDAMIDAPAVVRNGRLDLLATNELGRALYAPVFEDLEPGETPNLARFQFLSPRSEAFYPHWDKAAHDCVALLRAEAGRDPYDRALTDLVGELSTRSEEFRVRWARHNVSQHRTGRKHAHHPLVGGLTLAYEALDLPGDPGQTMLVYTAEPDSPSAEALRILASWTSAPREADRPAHDTEAD